MVKRSKAVGVCCLLSLLHTFINPQNSGLLKLIHFCLSPFSVSLYFYRGPTFEKSKPFTLIYPNICYYTWFISLRGPQMTNVRGSRLMAVLEDDWPTICHNRHGSFFFHVHGWPRNNFFPFYNSGYLSPNSVLNWVRGTLDSGQPITNP